MALAGSRGLYSRFGDMLLQLHHLDELGVRHQSIGSYLSLRLRDTFRVSKVWLTPQLKRPLIEPFKLIASHHPLNTSGLVTIGHNSCPVFLP